MRVPFLDLAPALDRDAPLIAGAVSRVVQRGQLVLGPEVVAFESAFADFNHARHCVAVGNGFDALCLMLQAATVGPGDEVIVPANTYIATWLAVSATGARVVPVDPDEDMFNLDPAAVEMAMTAKTKAVLAVHLYGGCAKMDLLQTVCEARGVYLLADAAQAAGTSLRGRPCGALGMASAFSFYPTKNLGALGDGGAVVTDSDELAERIRLARNYGSRAKDVHVVKGRNSRLDEIQAAILLDRLRQFPKEQARRREIALKYRTRLSDVPGIRLPTGDLEDHAWHLFTVRVDARHRDRLRSQLSEVGIGTGIYYPVPPHQQAAYMDEISTMPALPVAERLAAEIRSLPLNATMTDDHAEAVIAAVRSCAAKCAD